MERSKPEFEADILESLKWLGIEWSEGPFKQSERLDIYAKYLKKLLADKKAYHCFCSDEELEAQRQYRLSQGQPWRYNGKCSQLSPKEIKKNLAEKKPSIIRFKMRREKIAFEDLIRGKIEFDSSLIGDFSIARNISSPLFNFAVTVDDFEMRISHVIRAEEHITNTPKQILIQEALGFPRPQYAHLPLILAPDRSKLSKRQGATAVSEFKKEGYLPETLVNFIAFLGWNPGGEREIYSMPSLIKEFSFEKVQKGGAVFNVKRLDFLNGFYIRQKSVEKLTELCLPYFTQREVEIAELRSSHALRSARAFDYLKKIVEIYQERLKKLSEITELTDFFFKDKLEYDKKLLIWKQMAEEEVLATLDTLEKILSRIKIEDWTKEKLEETLIAEAEKMGDRGVLLWPLRVALTGKEASAAPFEIAEILGKEKTIKRINEAREILKR